MNSAVDPRKAQACQALATAIMDRARAAEGLADLTALARRAGIAPDRCPLAREAGRDLVHQRPSRIEPPEQITRSVTQVNAAVLLRRAANRPYAREVDRRGDAGKRATRKKA